MTLAYQSDFIDLCMRLGVLRFGSFTLKSGRESPYFFNAGLFNTGAAIAAVGRAYAAAVDGLRPASSTCCSARPTRASPWSTVTAAALAEPRAAICRLPSIARRPRTTARAGDIVGGPLSGRVLIVDDVITAGTAIRESIDIIRAAGARPAGVLLALDRQERGPQSRSSAVQEVRDQLRNSGHRGRQSGRLDAAYARLAGARG